ncbi:hypothetical protein E4U59_000019 [Claviceps monticola]|nr:hypothetical protein E4U59_000019 [Claviceps monticola]
MAANGGSPRRHLVLVDGYNERTKLCNRGNKTTRRRDDETTRRRDDETTRRRDDETMTMLAGWSMIPLMSRGLTHIRMAHRERFSQGPIVFIIHYHVALHMADNIRFHGLIGFLAINYRRLPP